MTKQLKKFGLKHSFNSMKIDHKLAYQDGNIMHIWIKMMPENAKEENTFSSAQENSSGVADMMFNDVIRSYIAEHYPGFTIKRTIDNTKYPFEITIELITL